MGKILAEKEAEDFLEKNGFPVVERKTAKTGEDAIKAAKSIGFPVVLKISSGKILHKTESGGVAADLRNEQEIAEALKKMPKASDAEFLVQKFVKGIELLAGLKKDATFGHVLLFGSGGIYTEILKDTSKRILPAGEKDIEKMIDETRASKLLAARSRNIPRKNIADVLHKLAKLAEKHPEIEELDINPLIINEKECVVADARIVFGD